MKHVKYLFYAIVYDVAGNITPVGSSAKPAKAITTNIQKVTGISINPNSAQTKNIGDTFKITATVSPSDANNKSITWSSSSTSVATVDSSGNVRCLSAGTTTITATAADGSGKSSRLTVTVRNPINSLTLDKDQTTILKDGYTSTITAITDPANYDEANISWSIADTSIATVTVNGKTATIKSTSKIGQTTLTVSAGGITKTVNVSVVNFTTQTYSYTGTVQQVDLPAGTYKLEVWGAQAGAAYGNDGKSHYYGGYGGYSCGTLSIRVPTTMYVVVGGKGNGNSSNSLAGGYNGGGSSGSTTYAYNVYSSSSGGGATHIGLKTGLLSTYSSDYTNKLLLVAGGGGGYSDGNGSAPALWTYANSGGGFNGGKASEFNYSGSAGNGATQNSGYSFGLGGSGSSNSSGGGGGGFYGGYGGSGWTPGGGGSGYINISKLTNAFMYGYNVQTSSETATKTYSTTNVSSTPTSNYAKSGDGAARITPIN